MGEASHETQQQLLLSKPVGVFEVCSAPSATCGPREIVIRFHAITLNRFDVRQFETGSAIIRWPTVLGLEGSGVVEQKGRLVEEFNVGDKVFALCSPSIDNRLAAFQSHAVLDASVVCRKPPNISFADASSVPLAFVTATRAIREALELPATWGRTSFELPQGESLSSRRFFIFGGNTPVGTSAIQLFRYLFPDANIGATIYGDDKDLLAQEAIRMIDIGASFVIDGLDPDTLPTLERAVSKPPEVVVSFPHPPENDLGLLVALREPRLFSASELDLDITTITSDGSAVSLLENLQNDGHHESVFPAKVVGTGLQSVIKALEDVPRAMVKSKHVVLLEEDH